MRKLILFLVAGGIAFSQPAAVMFEGEGTPIKIGSGNVTCTAPTVVGDIPNFTNTAGTGCADSGIYAPNSTQLGWTTGSSDWYAPYFLAGWPATLASIDQGTASTQAIACQLGDSWTANANIVLPMQTALQGRFGNAGAGWVAAEPHDNPPTGITRSRTGTWSDCNKAAGCNGPDASDTSSIDTATPATITSASTASNVDILYMIATGGGSFTWAIDGGGATTVNTSVGTLGPGVTHVTGLTANALHTLVLTVTVAGSAGVDVLGFVWKNSVNGVLYNKLGNSGMKASDLSQLNQGTFQSGLSLLGCNLVMTLFGINELDGDVAPSVMTAALTTVMNSAATALPTAGRLLTTPATPQETKTYTMTQYSDAQNALARSMGISFLDNVRLFGSYAQSSALGLWGNTLHVNAIGGQVIANHLLSLIAPAGTNSYEPLIGPYITLVPTASGQSLSKIYDPGASTNDTVRFADTNFGAGYGNYWQWTKSSASGAQLDLFAHNSAGTVTNPITFFENGTVGIPATLKIQTLNANYYGGNSDSSVIFQSKYQTWTNPMFSIGANGLLSWGAGNAGALDVGLGRPSAGILAIGNGTQGDFSATAKLGNIIATAAAPTVAASQVGLGGTVTANTNCGTLASSAGCLVINVAGTTRYIPYY